jgi:predicted protein tyrosine phosphatase
MLKHVIFTSQQSACSRPAWSNWAVISITDVGTDDARLQHGWHDILRLGFDDIDHHVDGYVMCGEFHARAIIEFVTRCNDEKVEGILVHCYAGISRSAAVAKWIAERHGLSFPADYDEYNKHVYTTLREQHLLKESGDGGCMDKLMNFLSQHAD